MLENCALWYYFNSNKDSQIKLFSTQEKINIKSEKDIKKDRKRNLVPAKTGLLIIIFLCAYTISFSLAYAGDLAYSDAGTRNYFLSLTQDMLACVFAPGIIVFQAPTIRRKINRVFLALLDFGYFKMKKNSSEQEERHVELVEYQRNNKITEPRTDNMRVENVSTDL